jgi:hypothetical protein
MKDILVGPEDYKQLAERCLELASECSEPSVAETLRAFAVRAEAFQGLRACYDRHTVGFPNGARRDDNLTGVVAKPAFNVSHGFLPPPG